MGMAASQARYIELTARKTNVEYEGQQINQQRTALANESAGMFSQLMALSVPIPPSTSTYTTTEYTFNDGSNDCTVTNIKNLTGDPNYNASVSYTYNQTVYTGIGKTRTDIGVRNVSGTYWLTNGATGGSAVNSTKLTQCSTTDTSYSTDVKALSAIVTNSANKSDNIANKTTGFDPDNAATTIGNVYKYTATNGTVYYYSNTDLVNAVASKPDGSALSTKSYYGSDLATKQTITENAYVTKADSGRYSTIQLASETGTTLNLTATTKTDENAYNDAMNQYNYQQQTYQQQVTSINAKTSTIQVQDRTLEMKLKQLDTEQEALQTEMESVKKVIDKNIEQTFKTFQ